MSSTDSQAIWQAVAPLNGSPVTSPTSQHSSPSLRLKRPRFPDRPRRHQPPRAEQHRSLVSPVRPLVSSVDMGGTLTPTRPSTPPSQRHIRAESFRGDQGSTSFADTAPASEEHRLPAPLQSPRRLGQRTQRASHRQGLGGGVHQQHAHVNAWHQKESILRRLRCGDEETSRRQKLEKLKRQVERSKRRVDTAKDNIEACKAVLTEQRHRNLEVLRRPIDSLFDQSMEDRLTHSFFDPAAPHQHKKKKKNKKKDDGAGYGQQTGAHRRTERQLQSRTGMNTGFIGQRNIGGDSAVCESVRCRAAS
eukprot:CAMPEP_0118972606 /NCGR_PEP_ID=MMETSP1173-20130426/8869_1 /TAXON_ID=1034831 /ORGANISM="Rhizochromulina marina cf, Strain CCMP1243" /LENGTH=304 /DNA_ID=CAMNT_0006922167 /DNA_START=52 /DNA_END=964 /DNA_ORIENTATION=-